MGIFLFIVFVIVFIILGPFVVTNQQQAKVIERLGKFTRIANPGLSFKIPVIDRPVATLDLRIKSLQATLETKTQDNVFVDVVVSTQFRVDPNKISTAYYELSNPETQIQSYIADAIRSSIPTMTLDLAFENKEAIAVQVQQTVAEGMTSFGFIIVKTLITSIDPAAEVKQSMNAINAAQRQRQAAQELAEAEKIQIVTKAQANAEEQRLRGLGLSQQRQEIINGLSASINQLSQFGIDDTKIITLLMLNQYMDTLSQFAEYGNSTLMLPASPAGLHDLQNQIIQSIVAGRNLTNVNTKPNNAQQ
ncbi:MAG: SPFH domain-containing protein [Clostridiales bacterium]|jgi:regulator of protease activity HflC (stomatin/prohibitin superfamily)|nr:SPFH domain-containing protein [Clostridiales bacterium]